jgi:hypothetical protein
MPIRQSKEQLANPLSILPSINLRIRQGAGSRTALCQIVFTSDLTKRCKLKIVTRLNDVHLPNPSMFAVEFHCIYADFRH